MKRYRVTMTTVLEQFVDAENEDEAMDEAFSGAWRHPVDSDGAEEYKIEEIRVLGEEG